MKFKLKVKLDPAKHAIPHQLANKDPHGYTCGCVVSQAVNDAIVEQPGRFRRWDVAWADTGLGDTTIHVKTKNGNLVSYNANLPKSFGEARIMYDMNRGMPPEQQEPIKGSTRTLTFKRI